MKTINVLAVLVMMYVVAVTPVYADDGVPKLLNFQGRVSVDGQPFNGTGQFKFALVNADATATYWSNDATSTGGSEPTSGIAVFVRDGIYNVILGGDGMEPIPQSVFANNDNVYLRVWFNDNQHGFERLEPDQQIVSVAYALRAAVADNVESSSRVVLSGSLDSRSPGDESFDVNVKREYGYVNGAWGWYDKYERISAKHIPVADLDPDDMPVINIYWNNGVDDTWHNNYSTILFEGSKGTDERAISVDYLDFRVLNNRIDLLYPHLMDTTDAESHPYLSYASGAGSYVVYYKIVIMK